MSAGLASSVVEDVSAVSAWDSLSSDRHAQLIDVRTRAEWTYVGLADLSPLGKQPILVEWQTYPDNRLNDGFVARCSTELAERGAVKDTALFFLCRSGARSQSAAHAMRSAGYTRCFNIAEGFEGPLDARQRRAAKGWKHDGLPWVQG
jgi:rhodanese-related sulfurtransferase